MALHDPNNKYALTSQWNSQHPQPWNSHIPNICSATVAFLSPPQDCHGGILNPYGCVLNAPPPSQDLTCGHPPPCLLADTAHVVPLGQAGEVWNWGGGPGVQHVKP